ncbi:hypothetical protein AOLI_G00128960 [Acnodon oligacanthus]
MRHVCGFRKLMWLPVDNSCKTIKVRIIDDEEYEKNKSFFLEIGEPQLVETNEKKEEVKEVVQEEEEPLTGEEEEERRIAEMGKPMLGEHVKLEVIIEESYEFKNTVDKLIKKTNLALLVGTNSWRDQFIEAITVSAGVGISHSSPSHWASLSRRAEQGQVRV